MEVDSRPAPQLGFEGLEHDFASKTTLTYSNVVKTEEKESTMEGITFEDSKDDESKGLYWDGYCWSVPEQEDEFPAYLRDSEDEEYNAFFSDYYYRIVVENGQKVHKHANQWYISLNEGPPEGCDGMTYHLDLLKQIVGSDADEVYVDSIDDYMFIAILTDEEHAKLSGLKQVVETENVIG